MILLIFSLALIVANIYCFFKKDYLYLFVPCMLFLPEFYGIDFSKSLPIFTVTRMMYLVFYLYTFINKRRSLSTLKFSLKNIPFEYKLIGSYFALRLISNLCYITQYTAAIKTFFLVLFEQFLFLICVYLLNPTKKELTKLIKVVVFTACAFYIIGIFESFTFFKPFDALYTVSRPVLNDFYPRLGLLRATTTLGLPGFYGNMCLITLPLVLYLYELTREKKYLVIISFNILAVIHSGCRSDWFFYIFIALVYFIFVTWSTKRKLLCCKNMATIFTILLVIIITLSFISPYYKFFYTGSAKSVLNEIGFNYDLSEDAPEGSGGFGANNNYGSESRLAQFTGITYTLKHSPLVGLGSNAPTRGDIQYFSLGHWHPSYTYDVGYVQIFCDEGIIGFTGYILLFVALLYSSLFSSQYNITLTTENRYKILLIFSYTLAMLSTANMFSFLMTIIMICFGYKYTDS